MECFFLHLLILQFLYLHAFPIWICLLLCGLKIVYMYGRCHYVNRVEQLDRQRLWWQQGVWVIDSLSAVLPWMVWIRDIHTKGQSGRVRKQSCLKRPLFLIKTSRVPLSTSLPLSPAGISERSMTCPGRQTLSDRLRSVDSINCVRENWKQTLPV